MLRRAAWVADRVEAEVQAAERDATVSAAEQKVLHLLTPEVMKGQILQGLDQRRLQPGETPREYVEALKSQIQQVMPELTAESLDRMTIVQAIKGAPEAWSHKLGEGDLSSLDQLVTHMTLLHGKQRSAARRCQETGRSEVREPAATVCRCVVTDGAVEDFEDSLDEEVMPFLDQVKTQADLSHLSTVDQEKLKAVLDQSDVLIPARRMHIRNPTAPPVSEATKDLMARRRAALRASDRDQYKELNRQNYEKSSGKGYDPALAAQLVHGFRYGFPLGSAEVPSGDSGGNLPSCSLAPEVVDAYVFKELRPSAAATPTSWDWPACGTLSPFTS
ncbi:hypothetical protein FJT64_020174 [Amphibalanus amphitrite]|uniref:Uncharacterized protein n=1 Tax=Amphibalanus amphitrite TaxID=1232801 RepID=A0A6A4WXU3_AMPAM|nr:hypothetical protein FJT64_020174 [Amphibalanus amphitrite]